MVKINVKLEAFYGSGCGGCCYGSEENFEIDINEQEFEALQKMGIKEISFETVVKAIENGETTLQLLHEKLEEELYYMVEEYWLYEADNECLYESLEEHIEKDIREGLYSPRTSSDEYFNCHSMTLNTENDEEYCADQDYDEDYEEGQRHDLDAYYDWIKEHDHAFAAERVGLDLNACRDDEVNYTITFLD